MRDQGFWDWFDEFARPRLFNRAVTFAKMFEHLDKCDGPVTIVETGCSRRDPALRISWKADGCSTILFDTYAKHHPGSLVYSVDIDQDAVEACKKYVSRATSVAHRDSVNYLSMLATSGLIGRHLDLLYLDSFDFNRADPLPSTIHHHNELMAAMPMIDRQRTLVVVDDSPVTLDDQLHAEVGGKGVIVARHMALCGAEFAFCSYQAGWINVGPVGVPRSDLDLEAMVARARACVEADDAITAESLYRLILGTTTPPRTGRDRVAHGEACAFYAKLALAKQRLGVAADWFREALVADPHATDYRLDLIIKCFMPMGSMKSALLEAERATAITPDYAATWKVLGGVHHEMGNAEKTVETYERQLALEPDNPDAMLDMATIALDLGDYTKVLNLCARVQGTEREADAMHCLAMVAYRQHRHEEAILLYDNAIRMECRDAPTAHWNKSLALHSIGRYAEGWVEHEYRKDQRQNPALYLPMIRFTLPRWDGQPSFIPVEKYGDQKFRPAIIHVHYEAGAGDNLCLVRYLQELLNMGFRVRYECPAEMVDLIRTSMPLVEVVQKAKDYPGALGIEPFDYHIPIGSLPAVFQTDVDTVPWSGPYLKADPKLVEELRARFHTIYPAKIGICWSSGIRTGIWITEYGKRKSMHFETIKPIIDAARAAKFVPISLQIGPERDQNDGVISDVLPKKPTWAETAALIECLDLVITVDTAIAHLAGAMGKPVWLMCQRDACSWHFMCWRPNASWNERSPWYPTMQVVRQREFDHPHFWDDVVADIARELEKNHAILGSSAGHHLCQN